MFIKSIHLKNFLSYGPDSAPFELRNLNVIIGTNGAGKSNLFEALSLLKSLPVERLFLNLVREGGGVGQWLWRGLNNGNPAKIEIVFDHPRFGKPFNGNLRYQLAFNEENTWPKVVDEVIANELPDTGKKKPFFYYEFKNGRATVNEMGTPRRLVYGDATPSASVLQQLRDRDRYPEITYVREALEKPQLYKDWAFGSQAKVRRQQPTSLDNHQLDSDGTNLALVLNRLEFKGNAKAQIVEALQFLYPTIDNYLVRIEGNTALLYLVEGGIKISATRLSDGTLRYLYLLAILCDPEPAPLVCIEEPELGLHPDVIPCLAKLLIQASKRTQIIVTTHSDILIDALSDQPESVVVAEKIDGQTTLTRLDAQKLRVWLEQYSLGKLWLEGQLGGKRW